MQSNSPELAFLAEGGAIAALMRSHDWSSSPLGSPRGWPQSLRSVAGLLLASKFPMFVAWGPELGFLYNDAYAEILGAKHPAALGARFEDIWSEIWPTISPLVDDALSGVATFHEDLPLLMNRKGFAEPTWFTFSYSPVRDEQGAIAGLFCACTETTDKVLGERAQAFRLALEDRLRGATSPRDVMDLAVDSLGRHLGAARVGYSEVREDGETIDCHSCFANGVAPILGTFRLADFGPDSVQRQRGGNTEVIADVQADPAQVQETWAALDVRAFVSVPLVRDGVFTASLYVNLRTPHRWLAEEVALIEEVAGRTWDALERARADERLRESEERARRIVEGVKDYSIFTVDLDSIIVDWTPGAEAIFGWPASAIVGQSAARLFTPEDQAAGIPAKELATAREFGVADDTRWHLRRDGSRLFANGSVRPLHKADGSVTGFIKIARDETARRVVEAERDRALTLLSSFADAVPGVVYAKDREGRMLVANRGTTELIGKPPEAYLGRTDAEFLDDPLQGEAVMANDRRIMESGVAEQVEEDVTLPDGTPAIWLSTKAPLRDEAGRVIGLVGSSVDITARRRAELAVRELNATLEERVAQRTAERDRMWRLSTDLMLVARFDATITAVNPAWTSLLGWPEAELIGRPFIDLVHPDDVEATLAEAGRLSEGATTLRFENRYRHRDGSYRSLSWTAVPDVGLIHAVARDATAEKEAAADLAAAQEALRQAQKMEAMGQLTGGVAHDFNNLLTPIVGSLDLLQRKGLGGEREQRLIAGAAQSAERAKTLVQRLLAFARRQPLQPVAVDVSRLVQGMADLVASTTGPQIKVAVDVTDDLPPAKADPNQLEMALLNLAVNARDAMPDGGMLRISAAEETIAAGHPTKLRSGRYVCLSVADTGSGMDEATLARAVEPFFSTKGVGKGTGLGLSMVHGLASQLGGALVIRSRRGMGTNVELWLPVTEVAPTQPVDAAALAPAAATIGTALLVDDEELVRMSTADMLAELGYEVVEANSAEAALALLDGGLRPDLLVTDHLMPGMNGTDFAHALRERHPGVPALLVSGYAESEGIAPDLPRLTKPFRSQELAAVLAQIVAKARPGRR